MTTLNFTGTYPVKILAWPWKYHVIFALENQQNHVSKALHSRFFIKAKDGDFVPMPSRILTFVFEGNAFYRTYLIFIHSITKKLRRCCYDFKQTVAAAFIVVYALQEVSLRPQRRFIVDKKSEQKYGNFQLPQSHFDFN